MVNFAGESACLIKPLNSQVCSAGPDDGTGMKEIQSALRVGSVMAAQGWHQEMQRSPLQQQGALIGLAHS